MPSEIEKMADTLPNPSENSCRIFHSSPLTLQQLASMKVALQIWLKVFQKNNHGGNLHLIGLSLPSAFPSSTHIPPKIRKMIESCFNPVAREMISWNRTLRDYVHSTLHRHILHYHDSVVFGGNGFISIKTTLDNFFRDDSLSNETKFELACMFCIEDKVDYYLSRVNYLEMHANGAIQLDQDFMLYYWIYRKRSELKRIPLKRFNRLEYFLIDKCVQKGFYFAIEYFLSLFSADERLATINRLCDSIDGFECVQYLLPRLEVSIQRYVLEKEGTVILMEFIHDYEQIEYAVQCWNFIKEFIKVEEYYQDVIYYSIEFRNRSDRENEPFKYSQIELFLLEVWSSTPRHFKEYTLAFHLSDILRELSLSRVHHMADFSREIRFLLEILSGVDFNYRNCFWNSNWLRWITGVPPDQLKELMKMCLANSKAISDFAEILTTSQVFQEYCDKLISLGYHDDLNEFVDDLFTNEEQVSNLKKVLLARSTTIFTKSIDLLKKHAKYIDETFSDQLLAEDFKERLILSDKVMKLLSCRINQGCFSDVQTIASLFVSSKNPEEIIKGEFMKTLHHKLLKGPVYGFDQSNWENFLSWCLNNDQQRVKGFIKSLPIDEIFEKSIYSCLVLKPIYHRCSSLEECNVEQDLMKFLMWYFDSEELYEKFICQKIKRYQRMTKADVENIFIRDKTLVVEFLRNMSMNSESNVRSECLRILQRYIRVLRSLIFGCIS